jgi:hypothetical protein
MVSAATSILYCNPSPFIALHELGDSVALTFSFLSTRNDRRSSVREALALIDFGRFAQLCGHWAIKYLGQPRFRGLWNSVTAAASLDKIARLPVEQQRRVASGVKLPDENSNCYS